MHAHTVAPPAHTCPGIGRGLLDCSGYRLCQDALAPPAARELPAPADTMTLPARTCPVCDGRRRTAKSNCSSYVLVPLDGAPAMGRSLSPSIPSAIQRYAPVAHCLIVFAHHLAMAGAVIRCSPESRDHLSTGAQSHLFYRSIQGF